MLNYTNKIERETQERSSNIELLRILSMFLVLMIHYIPSRTLPTHDTLAHDTLGTLFDLELRSISFVCVNCFILISGYFGIRWKLKSFSNLLFQILFWAIICPVIVSAATDSFNATDLFKTLYHNTFSPLVYRSVHRTVHTGPDDKPFHRKIDTSGVGYIHSCLLSVQHLVRLLGKSL